jgi:hypothetical protein
MAVRTLGSVPRRLAALGLAVFLGQSASGPLLAGGGGQGGAAKSKPDTLAEQTLSAEVPAHLEGDSERDDEASPATQDNDVLFEADGRPREQRLVRSHSWDGDLRSLPQTEPVRRERPEREGPDPAPRLLPGLPGIEPAPSTSLPLPSQNPPAPATSQNFDGLDFATFGAGHPPDTNGDVGPNHYIQTINTSIGIYNKTGTRLAAFTFDTFMSQGNFGNICDTENSGDPVVLYDTFEDRWVITDFALVFGAQGQVVPPALQCVAVSKTGNPVSGGWNFYSIETLGGLGDYPKFGVWPDGIYMSANIFSYQAGGAFQGARVWAFNKAQMYAGLPTVQVVSFNVPGGDFTVLPSNARLQAGTPPAGSPNYFLSSWQYLNALTVYKFHVNWQKLSLSTFTGPDTPIAATSWPNAAVPNASSQGGNNLDVLQIRAMMQNQYSNIGGAESLWAAHTVRRQDTGGLAAPRWYQVNVTGGTVAAAIPQAATWDPDGANVISRFMPSLAVNRNGDMALGYSTSNSTTKPAIKYAGRLAADPVNTLGQTEQVLIQGTGTQLGLCGGAVCTRWGDYSAMTLDPDGCTFWYTNMYYAVDGLNHLTRVGAFALPGCTTVGNGTLTGTVTNSVSTAPIAGATVALGSRTTTTDSSGVYTFAVPAGTYPSVTASSPGFSSSTNTGIVLGDGGTTTQDFALSPAATAGCNTDTTQGNFQAGLSSNCDLSASPGDVNLLDADTIVQNINLGGSGAGITSVMWGGQTFTATGTGPLTKVEISLFCFSCSGTPQPLTLSVRATTGGLPSGADLASATIPGFLSGASAYYTVTFGTPPMLTSGAMYALVIRPNVNPTGTYALTRSGSNASGNDVYASGTRVASANSGATWNIPLTGGITTDAGFKATLHTGFPTSGTFVSSLKDANPSMGAVPHWDTLSWNATTPAGTNVQFQAAASNNPGGPFNFVGPDGTTGTFFTSGGSLAQFNGNRYLEYQASLTSSSSTATPAINDVTVCFQDVPTTTTAITSDTPDPSVFGAPVAVTYTVTANAPSGNTITGNVVVTDGVDMCTGTVADGGCALTLHTVGPRTLTATYQGDANFLASPPSVGEPHTVIKADTTAAITGDTPEPSVTGAPVLVSYTVTVAAPGSGTPTGTVTVTDGVAACTGTLPALSCSITLTGVGLHGLTATYSGDASFNASPDSAVEPHTVDKADTTASITADPTDPSVVGQAVTISYAVAVNAPGSGTPTGTVTVTDGVAVCTGTLPALSCSITLTTAGAHSLTATYNGDASFNASPASAVEPHTVNKADTTAAITSDVPDPSLTGQPVTVTYTVSVVAPGAGTPTGMVTVTDGVSSCTGTLPVLSCSVALTVSPSARARCPPWAARSR